jgi:Eukaryotic initiation factor 4E
MASASCSLNEHFLNDSWTLYFHDPNNNDWTESSYISLFPISTIEEFVDIHVHFRDAWNQGMFFMMREHIFPVWEDEHNKNGGCFSFKIMKPEVHMYWFKLVALLLGETMVDKKYMNDICGVSISPKRNFCILRVWVASQNIKESMIHFPLPPYTKMMFKSYMDSKDFNE